MVETYTSLCLSFFFVNIFHCQAVFDLITCDLFVVEANVFHLTVGVLTEFSEHIYLKCEEAMLRWISSAKSGNVVWD